MKKLLATLFFSAFCLLSYAQVIVVKDPTWQVEDELKYQEELAYKAEEIAKVTQQLETQRENLQIIKEATEKLKTINRRVANYRNLESSIELVARCYQMTEDHLARIDKNNCFTPSEYTMLASKMMITLSVTSNAINALTVVLTDNLSSMNDSERLQNMNDALKQLRDDVAVFYALLYQIELLENQRMQVQTLKYLNAKLKPE